MLGNTFYKALKVGQTGRETFKEGLWIWEPKSIHLRVVKTPIAKGLARVILRQVSSQPLGHNYFVCIGRASKGIEHCFDHLTLLYHTDHDKGENYLVTVTLLD